jgi:hypothetical protein
VISLDEEGHGLHHIITVAEASGGYVERIDPASLHSYLGETSGKKNLAMHDLVKVILSCGLELRRGKSGIHVGNVLENIALFSSIRFAKILTLPSNSIPDQDLVHDSVGMPSRPIKEVFIAKTVSRAG